MTEGQYVRQLKRAHRSEVFGEAVYAMAARVARNPGQRRKWEALCQLETRMKHHLSNALARVGVGPDGGAAQRWAGGALGVLTGLLPWRFTMTALGVITKRSTPFFERLESEGTIRQGSRVEGLGAHERAQSEFVRRELAGDAERSLDEVRALLAVGVPSGNDAAQQPGAADAGKRHG